MARLDLAVAKQSIKAELERRTDDLLALNHAIHADPELSGEEFRAAERIAFVLDDAGFEVEVGAYGMPTAIEALYGDGDLTVVICCEYDALPGIGHGCGHNVIAAAGLGAALALAPLAADAGLRIKLLGTPAEEHGGGKIELLREGAWEDADFSLMVHGMSGTDISASLKLYTAVDRFDIIFTGKGAHAASAPWAGINALSAATLALNAIGFLRQHMMQGVSMNAIISQGGTATNIISEQAVVQVEVRAFEIAIWRDVKKRVLACFEGAAIATGCSWEYRRTEYAYAPVDPDPQLAKLWDDNLIAGGRTVDHTGAGGGGSTAMGNVTQVLPAIHPTIAFLGETAIPHTAEFATAAITAAADQAMLDGAQGLAATVLDVALNPALRKHYQDLKAARPAGATQVSLES